MRETLKLLENDVERKTSEKRDLGKVIEESEKWNIELVESNKLAMTNINNQLTLTQKENDKLRKDLDEKERSLELLDNLSQEQQQELQKYHGVEKSGRCAHFEICGGKGNIFLGARTHRAAKRCPFNKNHEIHNM